MKIIKIIIMNNNKLDKLDKLNNFYLNDTIYKEKYFINKNNMNNMNNMNNKEINNEELNNLNINKIILNSKDYCLNHNDCIKNKGGLCKHGICNYIHPSNLNSFDKKIFMNQIQPNFTKQDYINWLMCHKDEKCINKLSYTNHKNLNKILDGQSNIRIPAIYKNKDTNSFTNLFIN